MGMNQKSKMISIIYDEIGDIWDEMWTWDDVVII